MVKTSTFFISSSLSGGAVLINNNGVETLYYGYADNQGSLIALTDANGNVVENMPMTLGVQDVILIIGHKPIAVQAGS